jgi:hypothetical protein
MLAAVTSSTHAYPDDLAAFVHARWAEVEETDPWPDGSFPNDAPPSDVIEQLVSTAYQASLLRDEERPVTFRAILTGPEVFASHRGPPYGVHRLVFVQPRPLDAHELRRLSQAAKYHRALLGVQATASGDLQIWGIVYTGPRWLQVSQGGRGVHASLPPVPVVSVSGPGRVAVSKGLAPVARLAGGKLSEPEHDVFDSRWLPAIFADVRGEMWTQHQAARAAATVPWAEVDPDFVRKLGQHFVRRIVATIRSAKHGGTVVFVPPADAPRFTDAETFVTLKHRFVDEEPRRRCRSLMVRTLNALAEVCGPLVAPGTRVGWNEHASLVDPLVAELDEALFEVAHLIAALADIDGAVIMTLRFEVLGFGAVVSGELPDVGRVARALDIEGEHRIRERTNLVGTRHNAAYRLCDAYHDALAIVISQDGGTRFVRFRRDAVTYWDQVGIAAIDT